MSDDAPIDPRELAEAEALAEALDGGEGPADAEALEAAALLGAQGRFELDADRFAAVRDRVADALPEAPRRGWRWLLIAAPALAAAVVAVLVLPTGAPPEPSMGAGQPQPAGLGGHAPIEQGEKPDRPPAPYPPNPLAPLLALQRDVIAGRTDLLPRYRGQLSALSGAGFATGPWAGPTPAFAIVAYIRAVTEGDPAMRQDLARRIAEWHAHRGDPAGARRWIEVGLAVDGPPTIFTAALHIERARIDAAAGTGDGAADRARAAEINRRLGDR